MNSRKRLGRARGMRGVALVAAVGAVLGMVSGAASAQPAAATNAAAEADIPANVPAATAPASVPAAQRGAVLGSGWQTSTDRAVATSGDADGFHLLVADAARGYDWRTLATLSEPGIEADQWIGNVCVTGSGKRAAVVYAPRTFTNKEDLAARGGFTAVVDLSSGAVSKLPIMTTLAYYNPGCGAGEQAVLTQEGTESQRATRLIPLDTATGTLGGRIQVPGQLTSAVPTAAGIVAADNGKLVRVDGKGTRRILALTTGVPFRLAADANGGVVYLEQRGKDQAQVRRSTVPTGTARGAVATLASGALTSMDVASGKGGRVFLTGSGTRTATALPASVSTLSVPVGSRPSLQGSLAVTGVEQARAPGAAAANADPAAPQPFNVKATVIRTGRSTTFSVLPGAAASAKQSPAGRALSPAITVTPKTGTTSTGTSVPRGAGGAAPTGPVTAAGDPHSPADLADRYCSVPRNDPANQAMQPKPRQVEWAVDQAVRGVLTVSRPANWKNLGMPAYTPQGLFPNLALTGGGFVPSQIMLGIAAQESNLWEAARFALPGATANPLIGNYFGNNIYNADPSDDWTINWANADCGYGVTQVTDGMRLAGHEKPGETSYAYQTQRAIALDFAVNVAAGLRILVSKWNQVKAANLSINNGDPSKIENWYFAAWAYNSGFHAQSGSAPWGLGWANNPASPHYPANRAAFLDNTYNDAAHPQDWPYEEKVIGWAGHPLNAYEAPDTPVAGYRAAWWNGGDGSATTPGTGAWNRAKAQAPPQQFCDSTNNCAYGTLQTPNAPDVVGEPAGPCQHKNSAGQYDLQCWYHVSNTWKTDCSLTCGNELLRFDPGYAYQDDGNSYPPNCSLSGLPSGALIVDDVPDSTPIVRSGCSHNFTNAGTFTFNYKQDSAGQYPGKMDTHQLGAGFGGHFWFTHTRTASAQGGKLEVGATWQWNSTQLGFGRILVHLPDLGAQTALARYVVTTAWGDRVAVLSQPSANNRWVSIGVWQFANKPKVTLSSVTPDGTGDKDIAFDAIAYQPLAGVETIKILHWNLDGAKDNHGNYDVVDRFVQEILAKQPDVISMNEICERQFVRVGDELKDAGYHVEGYFHASQVAVPNCFLDHQPEIRTSAGNAILIRGTMHSHQGWMFNDSDPTVPDGQLVERTTLPGETRSIACVTARIDKVLQDVKACSAHLAQRDDTLPNPTVEAEAEIREMARVFGPEAQTTPFILAGDMNTPTPPANDAMTYLYPPAANTSDWSHSGQFVEVNQQQQCITTIPCEISQGGVPTHRTNGGVKLDYVFGSRWSFVVPVNAVSVNRNVGTCDDAPPAHDCSDHWLFYSELELPPFTEQ
jgi:endonuclease/exonuclease/phosphatase family metal-dependent hydrolase